MKFSEKMTALPLHAHGVQARSVGGNEPVPQVAVERGHPGQLDHDADRSSIPPAYQAGSNTDPNRLAPPEGRQCVSSRNQWRRGWHVLAQLAPGIPAQDPRYQPILHALEACDQAFEADAWDDFQAAARHILTILAAAPPGR